MLITRSKKKIYIPTFATMRNSDLSHFVDTNIHSSSCKNNQGHYSSAQNLKKQPLSQPHRALPSLLPPFPAYQCPPHWTRGGIVDAGRICVNPHLLEPSPCPSSIHSKKLFHLCIGSSLLTPPKREKYSTAMCKWIDNCLWDMCHSTPLALPRHDFMLKTSCSLNVLVICNVQFS